MSEERNGHEIKETVVVPSVLGYELDSKQYVITNYLIPSVTGCLLYVLHFACDLTVAYRHVREDNAVWGALTIFFMFLPALGCYILTISAWELWPTFDGCDKSNVKWGFLKTFQHVCFPVWSMWRYAEKIFWSIEGVRSKTEDERQKILDILNSPRTIELYYFLQGYLQAVPQILLQLHILMRFVPFMEHQTASAQALSITMSLAQMAKTTTLFQRFKTQKIGGKHYPWFKPYKYYFDTVDHLDLKKPIIVYHCKTKSPNKLIEPTIEVTRPQEENEEEEEESIALRQQEIQDLSRRRSSDFYELPTSSQLEALEFGRETSIVDGPQRLLLRDDAADFFNPKRLFEIKSLPEDDVVGKGVSFLWWFCFLLARMLTISSFAYFYPTEIIWILSSHFILVVALLLYDIRYSEVRRNKAIFFIFIGFVYLFCLIEFKVKFKKPKFIYNGFFLLMFTENFTMVLVWWFRDMVDIMDDWWFKYIFYLIIGCSILSIISMLFYIKILKPKKVVLNVLTK